MISYLQVEDLTKSFGDNVLFSNITFGIAKDQKIGLIAKNGTGKSTLLRIISDLESADSGSVTKRNGLTIGYLEQEPDVEAGKTVFDYVYNFAEDTANCIREYEAALADNHAVRIEETSTRMDVLEAWDYDVRIKQLLYKVRLEDMDARTDTLSGGEKKRAALAAVLLKRPDLLIIDEPTNHLDTEMIEWLEDYMTKTRSTILMVTHDRYFLDRVCNEILEMDNYSVFSYKGNYSYFLEKREERIAAINAASDKAKNILRTEQEWMRRMPKARGTKAKSRIDNFHKLKEVAATRHSESAVSMSVGTNRLGKKILDIDHISKSFDGREIIGDFSYKFARGDKIGIVGRNGSGKSTFLNLITGKLKPDSGTIEVGETIVYGYYNQSGMKFKPGDKVIDVIKEIAETVSLGNGSTISASAFLEHFLFPVPMQYNHVEKLSGGEKRRLYMMTVLMHSPNFLILDEPTNDLDIMTLNVLEDFLADYGGVLLVVSHDRYFLDKITDRLFVIDNGNMKEYPGMYSLYLEAKKAEELRLAAITKQKIVKKETKKPVKQNKRSGLTYKERLELEKLEANLETLETEKAEIETLMNSGSQTQEQLVELSKSYSEKLELLEEKEFRWLELSEK